MKKWHTISILMILCVGLASAQIPNGGFENWTGGEPDDWVTSNSPVAITVSQSASGHTGSAARGEVITVAQYTIQPVLQIGPGGEGVSHTERPNAITGWYMLSPVGGDAIGVNVVLTKGGLEGTVVATAAAMIPTAASTFQQFSVPFTYLTSDVPDIIYIQFQMVPVGGGLAHAGSTFVLDDLELSSTSAVAQNSSNLPTSFSLDQNYPNPFNPSTTIRYGLPHAAHVQLSVFTALGQHVADLVNGDIDAGYHSVRFDGTGLASGMYFYRLQAADYAATRALLIAK